MANRDETEATPALAAFTHPLTLRRLAEGAPTPVTLEADDAARDAIAAVFEAEALDRLSFTGTLSPLGAGGWALDARLLARIVQPCVVTLAPVVTEVDEPVRRRYLPAAGGTGAARATLDVDAAEEEEVEPLPQTLD
ncbi:MAG: DUF177 domain-containing protein, partial [Pseudomonadota bacterium]